MLMMRLACLVSVCMCMCVYECVCFYSRAPRCRDARAQRSEAAMAPYSGGLSSYAPVAESVASFSSFPLCLCFDLVWRSVGLWILSGVAESFVLSS